MHTKDKKKIEGFSEFEREAMKERARELAAEAKVSKNREAGEAAVVEAISKMSGSDQEIATRVHEIVKEASPELFPKTWYGMPAYAKNDKVVCFFQPAEKFKARYSTLGFSDVANLDEGNMFPSSFAIKKLTKAEEDRITALVRQAVS